MANERLRTAMAVAQIDLDAIAEATGADFKTVQRWINGRIPVARYRSKIVQLVGEEETYLWPDILDGERIRTATESELVALYARRAQVPTDLWLALFRRAERNVDVLAYAGVFLHEQNPPPQRPPPGEGRLRMQDSRGSRRSGWSMHQDPWGRRAVRPWHRFAI